MCRASWLWSWWAPACLSGHTECLRQRGDWLYTSAVVVWIRGETALAHSCSGRAIWLHHPVWCAWGPSLRGHAYENILSPPSPRHFCPTGDYFYLRLGHGYETQQSSVMPPKLAPRYVGRFKVVQLVGRLAYKLDLPQSWGGSLVRNCKIVPILSKSAPPGLRSGFGDARRTDPTKAEMERLRQVSHQA